MPSTFIFGCLKVKIRFHKIPFPKTKVYSDVVLDNLRQKYKSFFFPSKNTKTKTLKVAHRHSPYVWKFSRPLNFSELCKKEIGRCLSEQKFKENKKIIG